MDNKLLGIAAAALAAGSSIGNPAMAAEFGTVVARTPVHGQVAVPRTECAVQDLIVRQPQTGAGALIGALVGGSVGNALGGSGGRAATTGIGVIAGALVGDRVEANAAPSVVTPVQSCRTVSRVENRLVGYDVVYDFNGQRYSARLAADPGEPGAQLALNVTPSAAAAPPAWQSVPAPLVYAAAPQVVYAPPVVYGPVYPAFGMTIGTGWGGGWGGGRRWH